MAKPYSTVAQVLDEVLTDLVTQASWNVVDASGIGVSRRIAEGDNQIDSRLGAMGYALPFATNPAAVTDLSILYACYACFRDLYAASSPGTLNPQAKAFKDRFDEKMQALETGLDALIDSSNAVIPNTQYLPQVSVEKKNPAPMQDNYPNSPNGPYPDPPGIEYSPENF